MMMWPRIREFNHSSLQPRCDDVCQVMPETPESLLSVLLNSEAPGPAITGAEWLDDFKPVSFLLVASWTPQLCLPGRQLCCLLIGARAFSYSSVCFSLLYFFAERKAKGRRCGDVSAQAE